MRHFLVASASSAALAGTAMAAPPAPMPVAPSWTGFYVGLDAGWIQNRASVQDQSVPPFGDPSASMSIDGVIGGAHLGYNWQYQQFVLGVEADMSGATGSKTASFAFGDDTFTSRINWLSTFRGRFGVTFDQWLLYGTAGLAMAGVHNTRTDTLGPFVLDQTTTKSGFVWGGGIERMFTPNWTGRVEALAVDLGSDTTTVVAGGLPYITNFSNKAVIVRGGVSYRW